MKTWDELKQEWFKKHNIENPTLHDETTFAWYMATQMDLMNPKYRGVLCDDGIKRYEEIKEV